MSPGANADAVARGTQTSKHRAEAWHRNHQRVSRAGAAALAASYFDDGAAVEARREELRPALPIRRVVGPADIAALAIYLTTNTATTGATYDIDGGQRLLD